MIEAGVDEPVSTKGRSYGLIAVLCVLVATICLGYYWLATTIVYREATAELQAVSAFKVDRLVRWRAETLTDAERAASNPLALDDLLRFVDLGPDADPELVDAVRNYLRHVERPGRYFDILLLSDTGDLLASSSDDAIPPCTGIRETLPMVMADGRPRLSEAHPTPDGTRLHIDAIAPLLTEDGTPVAALAFRMGMDAVVQRVIDFWPQRSQTAHSSVIFPLGDEVLIATGHESAFGALAVQAVPATNTEHFAVRALHGETGRFDGIGTNSRRVAGYSHPVDGSSWAVTVEIDREELIADARTRAVVGGLIGGFALALAAALMAAGTRGRIARLNAQRYATERRHRETLEEYRTALYSIGDGVIVSAPDGTVRQMNPIAEALTGWREAEATGRPLSEVFVVHTENTEELAESLVHRVMRDGETAALANHAVLTARDGTCRPIADSAAPIRDGDGTITGVVIVFRDQTEARAAEQALVESESRFRGLYDSAEALIIIHDPATTAIVDANAKAIRDYGFETLEQLQTAALPAEPPYTVQDAYAIHQRVLEEGPQRFEWKSVDIHGRVFWEDVTAFAIPWHGKRCVCSVGTDITARKAVELERDQLLSLLSEAESVASLGGWQLDIETGITTRTRQVYTLYGIEDHRRFCKEEALNFYPPADRARLVEALDRCIQHHEPYDLRCRFQPANGPERWVRTSGRPVVENGKAVRLYGIFQDITPQVEAEEALERELAFSRSITESFSDAFIIADGQGVHLEVNPAFTRIFGFTRDEILGVGVPHPYWPDEERDVIEAAFIDAVTNGTTEHRLVFQRKNGERFPVLITTGFLRDEHGNVTTLLMTFKDITAAVAAEQAMREQLRFNQSLIEQLYDGFVLVDAAGVHVDVNPAFTRMTGFTRADLVGHGPPHAYWPPEHRDEIQAAYSNTLSLQMSTSELIFQRKNGEQFPVLVSPASILDSEGQPAYFFATVTDISEIKRKERELAEVTAQLQAVLDNSPAPIMQVTPEGRYLLVNKAVGDVVGRPPAELIGLRSQDMVDPESAALFTQRLAEVCRTQRPMLVEDHLALNGRDLYFRSVLFPVLGPDGEVASVGSIAQDVTDQKVAELTRAKLEEQLRQAQKMEAIGQLAGGVAHDFNNMLGIILGHVDMLLEQLPEGDPSINDLTQVRTAAQRSAELTMQLLSFARKQTIIPRRLDINDAIEGVLQMLPRLIGEDITIVWLPGPGVWPVRVDHGQLDQLIVNLAANARDAMPTGGALHIETCNADRRILEPDAPAGLQPGEYVLLTISDTGCGMDAATVEHLFEPFFTTKGLGKGTGLGLASVYGVVKQNGGYIEAESTPGVGTTFRIYLPREEDAKPQQAESAASGTTAAAGAETILLVEDEPSLLAVNKRFLERTGYTVLAAHGGQRAIEIAASHTGTIDLLITDVVMPDMNGREVWDAVSAILPTLRCLFVSGYPADIIARHGVSHSRVHFLQKPFALADLAAKIREVMQEA